MKLVHGFALIGMLLLGPTAVNAPAQVPVPTELEQWVPWVLHGHEREVCPFAFNNATRRRCAWPGELVLTFGSEGGTFEQSWDVYAGSWLTLPGDREHWPQYVTRNSDEAIVVEREGRPAIRLEDTGIQRIAGRFMWDKVPESLGIPPGAGLVRLSVGGVAVRFPDMTRQGQLWLRERGAQGAGAEADGDRLTLQVFRRIIDEVPLEVVTRLDLQISGGQREVLLGPALLDGLIPVALDSRLPARLEPDGRIRLQVRPGHWVVDLRARHPAEVRQLAVRTGDAPWPSEEVWVFDARNQLRLVEPGGLTTLDPRQTTIPADWQHLPTFRAPAGDTLELKVIRRGDPEPEPDRVNLARTLWLDFDGRGYTVQDHLSGSLSRGWRLEAQDGLRLGRVLVDGVPQFITQRPDAAHPGVEVRRGSLSLVADSRWSQSVDRFPAVGWQQDVQTLQATLHLPPGWEVFKVGGTDNKPSTWLARWSLLDLFLVLIGSIAAFRMWGWRGGVLTLAGLALTWHAPGAPRWTWLNLFAAVALLRVVPAGRLRQWVQGYHRFTLAALVLLLVPFAVSQIKTGLFPSLEHPYSSMSTQPVPAKAVAEEQRLERDEVVGDVSASVPAEPLRSGRDRMYGQGDGTLGNVVGRWASSSRLDRLDPKAQVQTGPGLPNWQWSSIQLVWNGPVKRDQMVSIVYISPTVRMVIHFLRVLLAGALALVFASTALGGRWVFPGIPRVALIVMLWSGFAAVIAPLSARAEYPPENLLNSLEQRLLEPAVCLPNCAEIPRLRLDVSPQELSGQMEIHASEHVGIPLPGHPLHWTPTEVTVDGRPATGVYRTPQDELWIELEPGTHRVDFRGPLPARSTVQIPFMVRPRRVDVQATGWAVDGIHENGLPDAQIQLTRIRDGAARNTMDALEPGALSPFVRVERHIVLDLEWRVSTTVVRLSPLGTAAVIKVPLLASEAVTTPGIRTDEGNVLVNLAPQSASLTWESTLEIAPAIVLVAPKATEWIETWTLDPGPVWHIQKVDGIPVVHHQSQEGRWLPQWQPFPGETVRVTITRPEGVEGQTLTIEQSHLSVSPGQRATEAELHMTLRSSLGAQHILRLPEGAELQTVTINGTVQPIRQEGRAVTVPVVPGTQEVDLSYRAPISIGTLFSTDPPDLGASSVNHSTRLRLGQDRWVLLTLGPRLGPAVLFWGALVVVILAALVLGRVPLTPLRWWHWLLLGIGFTQSPLWTAGLVVCWLLALGLRRHAPETLSPASFNLMQVSLAGLTLFALSGLFTAVKRGLLGFPEMMVLGNGSSAWNLQWFADRVASVPPRCMVVSLPLMAYRLAMLAWALWLAFSLLGWLRWGWDGFSGGGFWRAMDRPKPRFRNRSKPSENDAANADELPGWEPEKDG